MAEADHAYVYDLDNSGHGPLRVPGFGGVPVDYQLPVDARFAHGDQEWRQSPIVTAQESAMVAVMDRLTDKPAWFIDVFDDVIVARWRAELDRDHVIANPRLMKGKTWAWCVQELRDKAVYYKEHQYIRVLDTGSCVCKADSAELQSLGAVLRRAVVPLADEYKANRERQERREYADAGSDAGWQAQDDDYEATGAGRLVDDDTLAIEENEESEENEEANNLITGAHNTADNQQAVEDGHRAKVYNTIRYTDSVENETDDDDDDDDNDLSVQRLMFDADLTDLFNTEDDEGNNGDNGEGDNTIDLPWNWTSQTRLEAHRSKALEDVAGSAYMISVLVDPLLFPLVYGRTLVVQHGGSVTLDNILASYSAVQTAPRQIRTQPRRPGLLTRVGDDLVVAGPWSRRYQSLPCEVAFANDGGGDGDGGHKNNNNNNIDVKITSYINGLHPGHAEMYRAIEQVLSRAIQPWNDCLVRGHRGFLWDSCDLGQLGPVPARIITYGVEWDNELPNWATAFRVPTESRKKAYHEQKAKMRRLPEGSRERKRDRGYLRSMFTDVIGKEDWTLPPRDSDLWQRAKEYLARRPEGQPDTDGATRAKPVAVPDDDDGWDIVGDERTWDRLCEKARELLCHKHPELGTAFSYDDWKLGRHESRPIINKAVQKPCRKAAPRRRRSAPAATLPPPHMPYSEALQDRFRDQGLQVLVEINSIDLTPETQAYAPNAAARETAYTAKTAEAFAKAVASNTHVNLDGQPPDTDGWRLPGHLNEHIVAVAVVAFDVANVTEPRLAFRQRRALHHDKIYRFSECFTTPENASPYYDFITDGPAHLIGKENDAGAVAEMLGLPRPHLWHDDNTMTYPYQHVGSVATPQGRLVVFPNVLEHRINPFRLVDETQPGRCRWLTLHLVDPHYRVCSTRNVPPQQHDWWAAAAGRELAAVGGLSQVIIDEIMQNTDSWPMGWDEAQWHREQLVQERRQYERHRLSNVGW